MKTSVSVQVCGLARPEPLYLSRALPSNGDQACTGADGAAHARDDNVRPRAACESGQRDCRHDSTPSIRPGLGCSSCQLGEWPTVPYPLISPGHTPRQLSLCLSNVGMVLSRCICPLASLLHMGCVLMVLDSLWFQGSEAVDLAVQMARTHTGRQEMVALNKAYHGLQGYVTQYPVCLSSLVFVSCSCMVCCYA